MDDFWNQDENQLMNTFGLNNDPALAASPAPQTTPASNWGMFAAAMKQAGASFGGDAPDPGAYARKTQEQFEQFGQRVGFGKLPGSSNQAGAVALNPLNITAPLARPGEIAIRALSGLYR